MKTVSRFINSHVVRHTKTFVFLRMALGVLLFTKGFDFVNSTQPLQELLSHQKILTIDSYWMSFAVGWVQLSGAVFIALGLFTRVACSIQLILITVALLIRFSNFTLSDYALFEIIVIIVGLTLFLEKGSGKISLDRYFRPNQSEHLVFWG
jgi:putative oxidoreductase